MTTTNEKAAQIIATLNAWNAKVEATTKSLMRDYLITK